MKLHLLLCLSLISAIPHLAKANESDDVSTLAAIPSFCECVIDDDGTRRLECEGPGPILVPDPFPIHGPDPIDWQSGPVAMSAQALTTEPPILYINGTLRQLDKSHFTPQYQITSTNLGCGGDPVFSRTLVGYTIDLSVHGDAGQDLVFEINGRSDKSMHLSAQCGSFNASDSGNKFVISKQANTAQSCQNLSIDFAISDGVAPTYINLSVVIAETF